MALAQPPELPEIPEMPDAAGALPAARASRNRGTTHMQVLGVFGSHRPPKPPIIEELAREGSTPEDGLISSRVARVLGLCHDLIKFHTARLLADPTWCRAFAAA